MALMKAISIAAPGESRIASGHAVAVIRIGGVSAFMADMKAACASSYEGGWLTWEISHLRPIAKPFPALAARKIYARDVEDEFLRRK